MQDLLIGGNRDGTRCIDDAIRPEAVVPWSGVREIEAGNWVVWFRFRDPVQIASDRGRRKRV